MNWYKNNKDQWQKIIETVAAETHRTTQMIEKRYDSIHFSL